MLSIVKEVQAKPLLTRNLRRLITELLDLLYEIDDYQSVHDDRDKSAHFGLKRPLSVVVQANLMAEEVSLH